MPPKNTSKFSLFAQPMLKNLVEQRAVGIATVIPDHLQLMMLPVLKDLAARHALAHADVQENEPRVGIDRVETSCLPGLLEGLVHAYDGFKDANCHLVERHAVHNLNVLQHPVIVNRDEGRRNVRVRGRAPCRTVLAIIVLCML